MLYSIAGSIAPWLEAVPSHVPPGVQRMVGSLGDTPVAVFTATWTVIQWNELWAALLGDPSRLVGKDRNIVWRHFVGGGSRVKHLGEDLEAYERELVADIRIASIKYPDDRELGALIKALRAESDEFESLWNRFEAEPRSSARKTVVHPAIGEITLDCETLTVAGSDLRIIVFTAAPGSSDAANLELLGVVGTQDLRS